MHDLFEQAELLRQKSRYPEALSLYRKALKKSEGMERAECLVALADLSRMTGRFESAGSYYAEAEKSANALGGRRLATDALAGHGLSRRALGDWKGSVSLLGRALRSYKRLKDPEGEAFVLWALAGALRVKGDVPEAVRIFRAARKAFSSLGDAQGEGYSLCGLGGTTRVLGSFGLSLGYYEKANSIFSRTGDRFGLAYSHCGIGNAFRMKGDYKGALDHFRRAAAIYRRIGDVVSYSYTLWSMAKTYVMLGRPRASRRYLDLAMRNFKKTKDPRGEIYCSLSLAEIEALSGARGKARRTLASALGEAAGLGFKVERCHAEAMLSAIDGRPGGGCYKSLGIKLRFKGLPFNIP